MNVKLLHNRNQHATDVLMYTRLVQSTMMRHRFGTEDLHFLDTKTQQLKGLGGCWQASLEPSDP